VYENGGFHRTSADGRKEGVYGLTHAEIASQFSGYDASGIPVEGQFGSETEAQSVERAKTVARELTVMSAAKENENLVIVIVAHLDYICLLSQALLCPDQLDRSPPPGQASFFEMNNTAVNHLILGATPPEGGVTTASARLLYYNRSDHLHEGVRSGFMWKNVQKHPQAAAWARVGEGGSGFTPSFVEADAVQPVPGSASGQWPVWIALVCGGALFGIAASELARAIRK
jgi:hypothetical protein